MLSAGGVDDGDYDPMRDLGEDIGLDPLEDRVLLLFVSCIWFTIAYSKANTFLFDCILEALGSTSIDAGSKRTDHIYSYCIGLIHIGVVGAEVRRRSARAGFPPWTNLSGSSTRSSTWATALLLLLRFLLLLLLLPPSPPLRPSSCGGPDLVTAQSWWHRYLIASVCRLFFK